MPVLSASAATNQIAPSMSSSANARIVATTTSALLTLPPLAIPTASPKPVASATPPAIVAPLPSPEVPNTLAPGPVATSGQTLDKVINATIDKWKGPLGQDAEWGLVIHNLDTDEKVALNENKLFRTASAYKMLLMMTVFKDISDGKLSLDDQVVLISDAAAADEDGGSLIVPIGGSLPVRDLLHASITYSNNTASLMLLLRVGIPHFRQVVADAGFKGANLTDSYNFRATPEDFHQFLTRLADQKLLGPRYDQQMLDLMLQDQVDDRIPALLPPGTRVANKTGNLGGVVNDSALVFLPNGQRLVITVMVHQSNAAAAYKFIAELSLAAYTFYQP